ncbi:MAG TPA: response regulator [Gemmataceae bacterium]|nr:response regulator [Gemmataceae bacterium]
MAQILVVDDSAVDRRLAGGLLEKQGGWSVAFADNGRQALAAIESARPDLVLTDLQMPEMNGLELVEAVKQKYPSVPVMLMTAHGSDEIAIQALQRGAASYTPKAKLAHDLVETVRSVLEVAGAQKHQLRLLDQCWVQTETYFLLPNDLSLVPPLIAHLRENLTRMRLCDENGLIRVVVALQEALSNAILHGNLEINSELKDKDDRAYLALMEERRHQEPYEDRHVHVLARESGSEVQYVIRDEGPGFDPGTLPDPTDPANLERASGRGLLLIRTFMDEVRHNKVGNEITMIKRADRR